MKCESLSTFSEVSEEFAAHVISVNSHCSLSLSLDTTVAKVMNIASRRNGSETIKHNINNNSDSNNNEQARYLCLLTYGGVSGKVSEVRMENLLLIVPLAVSCCYIFCSQGCCCVLHQG